MKTIIVKTWADIESLSRADLDEGQVDRQFDPSLEPQVYDGTVEDYVTWDKLREDFDAALNEKIRSLYPEVDPLANEVMRCISNGLPTEAVIKDITSRCPHVILAVWSRCCHDTITNLDLAKKVHHLLSYHVLSIFGVPMGEAASV